MARLWKIVREGLSSEVLSIGGGVVVGLGLIKILGILEAIPGMIILVPGFMALRGNILGAMSARLGTSLHTGLIEPRLTLSKEVTTNAFASIFLGTFEATLIGIFAYGVASLMKVEAVLWKLVFLGSFGGTLASLIMVPFTFIAAIFVFQRGIDPDSVLGPIITSIGDVTAIVCLYLAAQVILLLG